MGQEIVPSKYDNARDFSEGLAAVALNSTWGFIDNTGKEIIPMQFSYVNQDFRNGTALATFKDNKTLKNRQKRKTCGAEYDFTTN